MSTQKRPNAAFVTDTSASPGCRLRPVPLQAVSLTDGFWAERVRVNRDVSIPLMLERLREHHVLDNFLRLYGGCDRPRERRLATDSDLYKWLESACYALANREDPELRRSVEDVIDVVLPAQEASGYLNTSMVGSDRERRWQDFHAHELYCAGHMFQAAVAHHRASGEGRFLVAACRFADHLWERFGPGRRAWYPGHPEVELALVELYRDTGRERYLELACAFLDRNTNVDPDRICGHAVRALYYACGMADCFAETGRGDYRHVLESHWRDMTRARMYVTGGVGSRHEGEMFGEEFELPDLRAYAETCAAAANVFWNWRLLTLGGEGRFADLLERTLYNGFLAGVSLDGRLFSYVNPLACAGRPQPDPWYDWARRDAYRRQEFFEVTCCPPNVLRLLAALPAYFYAISAEGVWVHLYGSSRVSWHLPDGRPFALEQQTDYPWDGDVRLKVLPETEDEFSLFLRVPGWCACAEVSVNGRPLERTPEPGSYLELRRTWSAGDLVGLHPKMPAAFVESNPRVSSSRGKAAIQRGPLVYCLEGHDNPGCDLFGVRVDTSRSLRWRRQEGTLGEIVVVEAQGMQGTGGEPREPLYRPLGSRDPARSQPVDLTAIPYYAWANRGPAQMTVWARRGGLAWT